LLVHLKEVSACVGRTLSIPTSVRVQDGRKSEEGGGWEKGNKGRGLMERERERVQGEGEGRRGNSVFSSSSLF
jgi:hypothetical protein